MKHTLKKVTPTTISLQITLDAADIAARRPLTIAKLSQRLKVPGFRAGRVPAVVAVKHIDPGVLHNQLLEDCVNASMIEALNSEGVRVLDQPQVDVTAYEPGTSVVYTATAQVVPEIKLGDYKKLKLPAVEAEVKPADIDEVVERMRVGFSEKSEVRRSATDGDEVWIDFDGRDTAGQPVAGASGKDYPLRLGSHSFIPGFEEGLVGKTAGEAFDLPLTFPADYHHAPLAGAQVTFAVTVNKVMGVTLPAIDDAFAAKCGPFTTVVELKADIKRELLGRKQAEADEAAKDALVEQLLAKSTIPMPEVLIADQLKSIEQDETQNLSYRGSSLEQFLADSGQTREQWRQKTLRPLAEKRVQVGLLLAELSRAEAITAERAELDARLQEMLAQYPDPGLRERLDTPEARRDIANRLITEKTLARLLELNRKK